jgi:hypothetical protein
LWIDESRELYYSKESMHQVQKEGKLADYKVACLKLEEKKGNNRGRKGKSAAYIQ